jgi:hypothetical protein
MEQNRENIPPGSQTYQDDEISLKELIEKGKELIAYFMGYKRVIIAAGLLGGGLGFGYAHFFNVVEYESKLTFAIEEKGGGGGSLLGLASQFGVDLGGGGGGGLFTSDNLLLLFKSNRIIKGALLRPLPEVKEGNLYNHYLATHFKKALDDHKIELLPLDLDRDKFNRLQDSLLIEVSLEFAENQLTIAKKDKKASFIDITVKDQSELFSFWMNRLLVEEATQLYIELKVGKMQRSVKILQGKVDSIQRLLDGTMLSAATGMDRSLGLVSNAPRVGTAKKQMEAEMLGTLFGELTKNLELTKFTLEREEPTIQIVDAPTLPLEKFGKGRVKFGAIGGFLLGFITLGWLFIRKILGEL